MYKMISVIDGFCLPSCSTLRMPQGSTISHNTGEKVDSMIRLMIEIRHDFI